MRIKLDKVTFIRLTVRGVQTFPFVSFLSVSAVRICAGQVRGEAGHQKTRHSIRTVHLQIEFVDKVGEGVIQGAVPLDFCFCFDGCS